MLRRLQRAGVEIGVEGVEDRPRVCGEAGEGGGGSGRGERA